MATTTTETATGYGATVRDHLARLGATNSLTLDAVANLVYGVVRQDGLIYAAGTGHSLAMVLETFYRAGGLACTYPVWHPALLPLEGGLFSTHAEKSNGLAPELIERAAPGKNDVAFVYSNSGVNAVPVELAAGFRACGTPVVAVLSREHMNRAAADGRPRLEDFATQVIDTLVPYGDASYDTGFDARTAPLSSISAVYAWTLILTRLAELAKADGFRLPIWTSSNVAGGSERNQELLARYRRRVPYL